VYVINYKLGEENMTMADNFGISCHHNDTGIPYTTVNEASAIGNSVNVNNYFLKPSKLVI